MKKLFIFIIIILSFSFVYADETTLHGEAQFDWVDISQIQRNEKISCYHNELFSGNSDIDYTKKEFKQKFSDMKKDSDYITHYIKAKAGITEYKDAKLSAFYYNGKTLIIYAVQYKNNLRHIYYYDCLGRLQYVDEVSSNYPNYPYYSKQYRKNGKLISAIYFLSKDIQYMYNPNGDFHGVWYKEKMYDRNGKQTLTRTNWGI